MPSEDCGQRPTKRERSRGHLIRRHNRLQRTTHDHTDLPGAPPAALITSPGRFTSFLVTDILGISGCVSRDPERVTSSGRPGQHQLKSAADDFSVERLIQNTDDNKSTCTTSTSPAFSLFTFFVYVHATIALASDFN